MWQSRLRRSVPKVTLYITIPAIVTKMGTIYCITQKWQTEESGIRRLSGWCTLKILKKRENKQFSCFPSVTCRNLPLIHFNTSDFSQVISSVQLQNLNQSTLKRSQALIWHFSDPLPSSVVCQRPEKQLLPICFPLHQTSLWIMKFSCQRQSFGRHSHRVWEVSHKVNMFPMWFSFQQFGLHAILQLWSAVTSKTCPCHQNNSLKIFKDITASKFGVKKKEEGRRNKDGFFCHFFMNGKGAWEELKLKWEGRFKSLATDYVTGVIFVI